MVRRVFALGTGAFGLILAAVLVMGLAAPASAFAAVKHKPVVTRVSPTAGSTSGHNIVTITGKHFKIGGKSTVKKVRFGTKAATHVHVKSATLIKVTAPAGTGTVNVRVTTKAGTSAKVSADKYTYRAIAAKYLVTSSSYSPVAGAAVTISAQLASASNKPVPTSGVKVAWTKAGTDGSFSSATSLTNASGIATVAFTTSTIAATSYTVTATDDSSRKGVSTKITTTAGPATQIALNAGNNQSATVGGAVSIAPSVIVKDANANPVSGVGVTFAVATGGGLATGLAATTNAAGVATVGSWKLGATAGNNTLSATSAGLTGSPVTFTATGNAGALVVEHNGTFVKAYSLVELEALTPFAGYAGLFKNPALGPDAVTGVKITDIVKDALGTPLTATQSVDVASVSASPYDKTMTYDQLVNLAGFTMYDATSRAAVPSPAGPLATVLVYSDPAQIVMPTASGPLRFFVADGTSENLVMAPTNLSVSSVNQLNVINP